MAFDLTYMGSKRLLAAKVAKIVAGAQSGPFLDVFSGMCSVGSAVGLERFVWNNDVQLFASTVAVALFQSQTPAPDPIRIMADTYDYYSSNYGELVERFKNELESEADALADGNFEALRKHRQSLCDHAGYNVLRKWISRKPRTFPYRLFTTAYSETYLGLSQCVQLDSCIYAIHRSFAKKIISADDARWLLITLGKALLRTATTTGHFAQFLQLKPSNVRLFLRQRTRCLLEAWREALTENAPIGDASWRSKNRVFNENCLDLLPRLTRGKIKPAVVYADPPYTDDQYSRYYHLLETVVLYDYPEIRSKGRYRDGRFQSPFSSLRGVENSFDRLCSDVAKLDADFVLSYPANGLLHKTGESPYSILKKHFRSVEIIEEISHNHSTFGASKGLVTQNVTEELYFARV